MPDPKVTQEEVVRVLREQAPRHAEAVARLQAPPAPPGWFEKAKVLAAALREKLLGQPQAMQEFERNTGPGVKARKDLWKQIDDPKMYNP